MFWVRDKRRMRSEDAVVFEGVLVGASVSSLAVLGTWSWVRSAGTVFELSSLELFPEPFFDRKTSLNWLAEGVRLMDCRGDTRSVSVSLGDDVSSVLVLSVSLSGNVDEREDRVDD